MQQYQTWMFEKWSFTFKKVGLYSHMTSTLDLKGSLSLHLFSFNLSTKTFSDLTTLNLEIMPKNSSSSASSSISLTNDQVRSIRFSSIFKTDIVTDTSLPLSLQVEAVVKHMVAIPAFDPRVPLLAIWNRLPHPHPSCSELREVCESSDSLLEQIRAIRNCRNLVHASYVNMFESARDYINAEKDLTAREKKNRSSSNEDYEPESERSDRSEDSNFSDCVKLYFKTYGPASPADCAWWIGCPVSLVNKVVAFDLSSELKPVSGPTNKKLFLHTSVHIPRCSDLSTILEKTIILGRFEPAFLAYRDKTWICDEQIYRNTIWSRSGGISPSVLSHGWIRGTWGTNKGMNVSFFENLEENHYEAVAESAKTVVKHFFAKTMNLRCFRTYRRLNPYLEWKHVMPSSKKRRLK